MKLRSQGGTFCITTSRGEQQNGKSQYGEATGKSRRNENRLRFPINLSKTRVGSIERGQGDGNLIGCWNTKKRKKKSKKASAKLTRRETRGLHHHVVTAKDPYTRNLESQDAETKKNKAPRDS